MIWTLLWVLVVMWLFHLAVPTPYMRPDRFCDGVYYTVWTLFAGTILAIHYTWMAHSGHAALALRADGMALGLFLLWRIGRRAVQTRHAPAPARLTANLQ